ncbi:glycosyltransferase [Rhodococcus antarcticus]|jgi:UDP:flavonoid glycosyltransferase YjiC (YdhE family)|uniref:Glycosyltransferase n=1 Tax=Rhodococcus antarcticus TaxID=2987751 RepID=A0ABY6P311_9NOCA|nr:glycosyltransferase [Rhodococcus antarcticus]UZJ26037.1 glycosyltransferase [Rhodococcus antarcticus]
MSDTRTARVLVATADLGGNAPPALGIAARLAADGADVHVIGHDRQRSAVAALGLGFTAYTHPRGYDARKPRSTPSTIRGLAGLSCDSGVGVDLLETAATRRSEVLLVDCMLLAALRAGARSGLPTVALVHTFPEFFTGPWAHGPIGALATLRGLRPATVWAELAGAVTVCLPELVGASTALGGPVVGPVWQGTPRRATPSPVRPVVLISLSTVWWSGQDAVAQRVLDAVGGLDVDAIFTTGPALDPAALTAPANVEVHRWADHADLLPGVNAVIGHGGHATTMLALAHDLPLLMLPMHPLVDQPTVARVVAEHGAGLRLRRSAPVETIRSALDRLVTDPSYRIAAGDLGARIRGHDGAAAASHYLRGLGHNQDAVPNTT